MKPYYSEDGITIFHGKAEDIVPQLPEKHFAVLVLDAPFSFSVDKTDDILAPFERYLTDQVIVLIQGLPGGMPSHPEFGHPHVRPLDGMREILARTGGIILDPYMGTGTTLAAAKQLGREAVGIEIEEEWCKVAVERLHAVPFLVSA